jgi:plastocyanin
MTHGAPSGTPARAVVSGRTVVSGGEIPAIVILEPRHQEAVPDAAGPAVLDQAGRTFIPPVLFVRVDRPAEFRNSDEELHNINVKDALTREMAFNVVVPTGEKYVHTFRQAGVYDVSCDVHAGMWAQIVSMSTPYAVVAGRDGTFEIPDVVPGSYAVTIFAGDRTIERRVDVAAPRTDLDAWSGRGTLR